MSSRNHATALVATAAEYPSTGASHAGPLVKLAIQIDLHCGNPVLRRQRHRTPDLVLIMQKSLGTKAIAPAGRPAGQMLAMPIGRRSIVAAASGPSPTTHTRGRRA